MRLEQLKPGAVVRGSQPIVRIEHYRLDLVDQHNPRVEEDQQAPHGDQAGGAP